MRVLVDATKDDAVVAKVVAKVDAVVVKVVDVADAEEAVANLHKVVRVSEACLISLSRPGTNHHRGHQGCHRKGEKYTPHRVLPPYL